MGSSSTLPGVSRPAIPRVIIRIPSPVSALSYYTNHVALSDNGTPRCGVVFANSKSTWTDTFSSGSNGHFLSFGVALCVDSSKRTVILASVGNQIQPFEQENICIYIYISWQLSVSVYVKHYAYQTSCFSSFADMFITFRGSHCDTN